MNIFLFSKAQDIGYFTCDTSKVNLLLDTIFDHKLNRNEVFVLNTNCFHRHTQIQFNDSSVSTYAIPIDSMRSINEFIGNSKLVKQYLSGLTCNEKLEWNTYVKQYFLVQTRGNTFIFIRAYKYHINFDFMAIRQYPVKIFSDILGCNFFAIKYNLSTSNIMILN